MVAVRKRFNRQALIGAKDLKLPRVGAVLDLYFGVEQRILLTQAERKSCNLRRQAVRANDKSVGPDLGGHRGIANEVKYRLAPVGARGKEVSSDQRKSAPVRDIIKEVGNFKVGGVGLKPRVYGVFRGRARAHALFKSSLERNIHVVQAVQHRAVHYKPRVLEVEIEVAELVVHLAVPVARPCPVHAARFCAERGGTWIVPSTYAVNLSGVVFEVALEHRTLNSVAR